MLLDRITGDGVSFDAGDPDLFRAQAKLLSAEVSVNTGDGMAEIILGLPSGTGQAEIRTTIRNRFTECNAGLKFLNASRWGETQSWHFHSLMPIPFRIMEANINIAQNPGW
jgi:hypothetical protein